MAEKLFDEASHLGGDPVRLIVKCVGASDFVRPGGVAAVAVPGVRCRAARAGVRRTEGEVGE